VRLAPVYPIDPVAGVIITSCFALLFGAAALHKLRALQQFAEVLAAYDVLAGWLSRPMSRIVPGLELLLAIGLLIPVARERASLAGSLLLAIYAAAIAVNLWRGRRELDCGCMGFGRSRSISPGLVWRNAVLALALLTTGGLPWSSRPLNWVDVLTIVGGVCAGALLYMAMDGLLEFSRRLPRRPTFARDDGAGA